MPRGIEAGILGSARDFIIACDAGFNVIYANPAAYELAGYPKEEVGLRLDPELLYDAATAKTVRLRMQAAQENGAAEGTAVLHTKDGRKIPVQQTFFAMPGDGETPAGVGLVMRAANAAEAASPEDGKMLGVLKTILNQMDACVYVSDMDTHEILFINRAMSETFHIDYDAKGLLCYEVIQQGMCGRCPFCPIYQLEQAPGTPVVWEECNSVTGRCYKKIDSVIEWTDGKKVHMQYAIDITENKAIQKEAENMLGILKNILNGMDAYVYVSDMQTDEILFINNRMKDVFGLDDRPGQTCWKVLQDDFAERCSFCPNYKLEQDPDVPVVWEEHNTVTKRHYKNVDSVIEWLDGQKVHMQHSTDITDILAAQAETHEVRERLEIALTASKAGVWAMDLAGDTFSYDALCAKLLGLGSEAGSMGIGALHAHFASVMPGDDAEDMLDALENRDLRAEWPERDSKLTFPDDSVRYIRSFANTVRDEAGDTVRVIGMNIDITRSVELENELKAAKIAAENKGRADADERTQTMLDATPLAASFWDADGNMLDCNMEAVRLFGLASKAEYIEHFYELNPEYQPDGTLTAEKAAAEIAAAFETGYRRFEWEYRMRDGTPLPVETVLVRVPWKGEYRLAAYSRDLRDIRAAEQERREAVEHGLEMEVQARTALAASEAKSSFLSNMSHEIRTPMNAIIGMTELFGHEDLTAHQRSFVNDIRVSAASLLGIINDILDFSKIEAGKLQLVELDYDLPQLLENIEAMFRISAKDKNISFEMVVLDALPKCVFGDEQRLRQVLVNIIGNAVKFTREGGVTFLAGRSDDMLCFDIEDTGMGMKEEDLPRIFNEFDQLDKRKNRSIAGTGLGLSITKNLVDLMGGSISVYSEYGKGTLFHVEVPLALGNAANLAAGDEAPSLAFAPKAAVLVVDDNEVNLNVAAGMLSLFGIACDTAQSGAEGIAKIEAKPYDIVFMDHMMPEMDGVEATRVLREERGFGELVIVALTANAVAGTREALLGAQMDDYLSKPIDKAELNRVLRRWLPEDKLQEPPEGGVPLRRGGDGGQPAQGGGETLAGRIAAAAAGEIDLELGLSRVGGQQAVFEKSVRIFHRRLPETLDKLEVFLAGGDIGDFAIEVHGLKGSLNNIGATALADDAYALELRAKDGDTAFCAENLPALSQKLAALEAALAPVLAEDADAPAQPGDRAALAAGIADARALLDAFESDEALEKLKALAAFDYGEEANAALRDAMRLAEEFEYDRAADVLGTV